MVRGVEQESFLVRPEIEIVDGRNFAAGRAEIIVGKKAAQEFEGLKVGDVLPVRDQNWTVVGHFTAGGSAYESEIWADLANVQSAYRRGGFASTMRIKATSPEAIVTLNSRLEEDPRFDLVARAETDHLLRARR